NFAFVEAAKAISPQRLHDANVNVRIVMLHEGIAPKVDEAGKLVQVMIQQLQAQLRRQVSLGIVQKRGDIVLQRAPSAALVIHKKWLALPQHHVPGLEITIEKVI